MNKFGSLYNLLCALDTNQQCVDTLTFTTDSGIERKNIKNKYKKYSSIFTLSKIKCNRYRHKLNVY